MLMPYAPLFMLVLMLMTTGYVKEDIEGYLREVAGFVPHWDHMSMALVFGPSPDNPDVPSDESSQVRRVCDHFNGKRGSWQGNATRVPNG